MIAEPVRLNHETMFAVPRATAGGTAPNASAVWPRSAGERDLEGTPDVARQPDAPPAGAVAASETGNRAAPAGPPGVVRLLSLVADRTRMRILHALAGGERPVKSITSELCVPQPTVSHHLAWLRMMDLVSPRRQGKHIFYSLGAAARCDAAGVLTLTAADATVIIAPRAAT